VKNATLIIAGLILASGTLVRAEEGLSDSAPMVVASAMTAPALGPALGNPVQRLPGMSPLPINALPLPVITDLSNAPNPFDSRQGGLLGQTRISYELAQDAKVTIEIYTLLGSKVRGWDFTPGANGAQKGFNSVMWDGTNGAGQKVSKGGYLAQVVVETPQTTATAIRKIGVIH
jgi:hypothetical protein